MSQIMFVTWNGGGNLLPALGIARELDQRAHSVAFLGQDTQRDAIAAARLPFTAYPHRADQGGAAQTPADRLRQLMLGTWLNTGLADDLAAILTREPADGVVIDCMLAGVLARPASTGYRPRSSCMGCSSPCCRCGMRCSRSATSCGSRQG